MNKINFLKIPLFFTFILNFLILQNGQVQKGAFNAPGPIPLSPLQVRQLLADYKQVSH